MIPLCRAVTKLGPGGLQSRAGDIIAVLREAHPAVEDTRARGSTAPDAEIGDKLRQRYDEAADLGSSITGCGTGTTATIPATPSAAGIPLATLARWCHIRSYLDSAAAHGPGALDAIRDALTGNP